MASGDTLNSAKLMGAWVIDMTELDAAHSVIAACREELKAVLEVRHTLWGVQVRTDSDAAADYVASHYTAQGRPSVAIAA